MELKEKLSYSSKVKEVSRHGENELKIMSRVPPQFKDTDIQTIQKYAETITKNAIVDHTEYKPEPNIYLLNNT